MKIGRKTGLGAAAIVTVAALALAGCSTGGSSGGSTSGSSNAGDCTPDSGVDWSAVQSTVGPYHKQPTDIPMKTPLSKPATEPLTIAYLDNGTPVSTMMWQNLQEIPKIAPNLTFTSMPVGTDAQSINTGLNSVLETKPDIVLSVALDPTFFINQLQQMKDEGITFVPASITNAADFGLNDVYGGMGAQLDSGRTLAAADLDLTCGKVGEYVFYNIPELAFSNVQAQAAIANMKKFCPDCTMRKVDIPVAVMDSQGADMIVSDLQSHPNTLAFAAAADEIQVGLAQKMQVAGLKDVPGLGQSSTPPNIQQIRDGQQAAGLATDLHLLMWLLVDQALRLQQGMPDPVPTIDWATFDPGFSQILTKDTAEPYVESGFIAVPDYQKDFAKLWGLSK